MRLSASIIVIALVVLTLGGCTVRSVQDEAIILDIAGPVAVDVLSFNGDVNIYADASLDHAEVEVVRAADHGYMREEESVVSLEEIEYSAVLESGPTGPVLTVRTWTTHPEAHYQRANVTINLPAVEGLHVITTNGRVYATNIQGEVDISTTAGDVRVMTNWPMRKAVTIVNENGDIDYRVRGESAGAIAAFADGGQVLQDCRYGSFRLIEHFDDRMLASFNEGSNPIDLRTKDGDIRVAIVNDPTKVGPFILEP